MIRTFDACLAQLGLCLLPILSTSSFSMPLHSVPCGGTRVVVRSGLLWPLPELNSRHYRHSFSSQGYLSILFVSYFGRMDRSSGSV